jgi:hypothetical protein
LKEGILLNDKHADPRDKKDLDLDKEYYKLLGYLVI